MVYRPGDHWLICDRCGMRVLHSKAQKTWDNLWVCAHSCWEPRHPQDFVRGRADKVRVDVARPDVPINQQTTSVRATVAALVKTLTIVSTSNLAENDSIGITLDDATVQWTYLTADPSGYTITINDELRAAATAGNTVYLPSVADPSFLAVGDVTQAGL